MDIRDIRALLKRRGFKKDREDQIIGLLKKFDRPGNFLDITDPEGRSIDFMLDTESV